MDPRVNAVRADVADIALAGRLFAPHYAAPVPRTCVLPSAMLRSAPDLAAPAVSELLLGEGFDLLDVSGGWAWGSSVHDRYVGYLPAAALGERTEPTHVVTAPHALVFAAADIKAPVVDHWPAGARFTADADGAFLRTGAGFVHGRHAAPLGLHEPDLAATAGRLLGTPYRWGGRSGDGIDCSGLVQHALARAGFAAPRDSDQQRESLGVSVPAAAPLARNDLVFFPGHVGIMHDAARMIHANAWWMTVTIEPLADVVARFAPHDAEPVLARKRIMP